MLSSHFVTVMSHMSHFVIVMSLMSHICHVRAIENMVLQKKLCEYQSSYSYVLFIIFYVNYTLFTTFSQYTFILLFFSKDYYNSQIKSFKKTFFFNLQILICVFSLASVFLVLIQKSLPYPANYLESTYTFSRDFLPINYGIILVINQLLGNYIIT